MFKGRSPSDITIDTVINCQCSCLFVLLITSIQLKVFKKPWGGYDFKAPEGWLQDFEDFGALDEGVTQQTNFIVLFVFHIKFVRTNSQPLGHFSPFRVICDVKNP